MATWALLAAAVLYLLTAADLYQQKQYGLALAFAAYALANIGLILAAKKI